MSIGPVIVGASVVLASGGEDVIGYVFAAASAGGQLQRWLLHRDPENALEIRPPPAAMAAWTLDDWLGAVPELWLPGSFYVRAQADVYEHGGVYRGVTWTAIPPAVELPQPTFPPRFGSSLQLDPTGARSLDVAQADARGLAYAIDGLHAEASAEYWLLPAPSQPGGAGAPLIVTPGGPAAASLQAFVDLANQRWSPGGRLAIVGCVNYRGDAPPAQR